MTFDRLRRSGFDRNDLVATVGLLLLLVGIYLAAGVVWVLVIVGLALIALGLYGASRGCRQPSRSVNAER